MSAEGTATVLTASEFAELAERMARLRARFATCLDAIDERQNRPDEVAKAIATHLGTLTDMGLPLTARTIWRDRIARPLKGPSGKPLPARTVAAIASWPTARVADLVAALREIEAIIADAENDARNEIIYAEISRAYS